ncbi:MAG: phospho-N-acetylmuramoyl-pentapeptide-transferase [Clostridiales bacterium]|nr:phospho-N-acetylmuramoyl-pentapeptide-transferase [Clostridiales bacterium]
MIYYLFDVNNGYISFIGIIFAFAITCIFLYSLGKLLPKDMGRDFAHDGKLSAGKPRGAGFLFIITFIISTILFIPINREIIVYLIYTAAAMITGFLDDCSKTPWGEYKKGLLDLIIAIALAVSYLSFNTNVIDLEPFGIHLTIHPVIFVILAVILIWGSINVTNCSDGVDGLSGLLTIVTLVTIVTIYRMKGVDSDFAYLILLLCMCILAYLWYNITPSIMIMGDAGSRAMGIFIAIAILKTNSPFLYIPVAFMLILDGGLGLVKVFLLRFLKIRILTKVRTPLHDHVRKIWGWSNTQVVFRFATIQLLISIAVVYMMIMTYGK